MGNCVGLPAKIKQADLDTILESSLTEETTDAPLAQSHSGDDELPGPILDAHMRIMPTMTPRLSRQSAFSRASMELPLNPFSPNSPNNNNNQNRLLSLNGGENLSLSFDDTDDDDLSVVSPSVGRTPFEFEFDVDDDSFVQNLLNDKKYTHFLCEKDQRKHLEAFKCRYCGHVLQDPVILVPCGHEFCRECFFKWKTVFHDQPDVPCPECTTHVFNQWFTPAIRTKTYMTQKRFRCKCVFAPECNSTIPICRYKSHLKKCDYAFVKLEIKTFSGSDNLFIEMRKNDSARDCIDKIIKKNDFDASKKWFLHIGSPSRLIADEDKAVKEFFNNEIWVGLNSDS